MEEATKLRKDLEIGGAIDEMRNHHGYKYFSRLVQDYYDDAVRDLIQSESVEARAIVKAITEINERLELRIALAKNAAEELKQDKFKDPWGAAE